MWSYQLSIKLTLALALLVSLLSVLALTFNNGRTASANPRMVRLLRREREKRRIPTRQEVESPGSQDPPKERTFKTRDFKDMPLAVSKIRNLHSNTWHQDLQIEVKNISTKPIYSILAYLEFPEHKAPGNRDTGIILRFGERKYVDIRMIGDSEDPHLNPGDTYVFTILQQYRKGLRIQHERAADEFKRLELHFGLISFGDGTGFEAGDPTDYRSRSIKQSKGRENQKHHANGLLNSGVRSPPQDGCGSCGRYIMSPETFHVCFDAYQNQWCESDLVTTASWAKCRLTRSVYWDCDSDGSEECESHAHNECHSCASTVAFRSSLPQPTTAPRTAVVTDLTIT